MAEFGVNLMVGGFVSILLGIWVLTMVIAIGMYCHARMQLIKEREAFWCYRRDQKKHKDVPGVAIAIEEGRIRLTGVGGVQGEHIIENVDTSQEISVGIEDPKKTSSEKLH